MGCPNDLFLDDAFDFLELLHQVTLRLQSPGCVQNADVEGFSNGALNRSKHDGARISAVFAKDDFTADSIGPNLELFDCSRTKCVSRSQQYAITLRG